MPKRKTKISDLTKPPRDAQTAEFDFLSLLNRDIRQIEFAHTLRSLGNLQVMEWDFRTVMPAVNKLAKKEVDLIDIFKRTAHYKVMEWDFRNALTSGDNTSPHASSRTLKKGPSPEEMQELIVQLKNFLEYVVGNLIEEPGHAQIRVWEIQRNVLRFTLVLLKKDVSMLIGTGGYTASAIRNILKAAAGMHGVHALLVILSHEEDMNGVA